MNSDYILLKEDPNVDYEPTMEEIIEEAKFLGTDPAKKTSIGSPKRRYAFGTVKM